MHHKKGLVGVAQGIGPVFQSQYQEKEKKRKENIQNTHTHTHKWSGSFGTVCLASLRP
jgi:hypothetical protein